MTRTYAADRSSTLSRRRFLQIAGGSAVSLLAPTAVARAATTAATDDVALYGRLSAAIALGLQSTVPEQDLTSPETVLPATVEQFRDYKAAVLATTSGTSPFEASSDSQQLAQLRALFDRSQPGDATTARCVAASNLIDFVMQTTPGFDRSRPLSATAILN